MKIFVSYSSRDSFAARVIALWIEEFGHTAMLYEKNFEPGEFVEQIENELKGSDCVVSVLSSHSVESRWCRRELRLAKIHAKPVLFASIERGVKPPKPYSSDRPVEMCPDVLRPSELNRVTRDVRFTLRKGIDRKVPSSDSGAALDLDKWFSKKLGYGPCVREALQRENRVFSTLHVATTVELAANRDGWKDEKEIEIVAAESPLLTKGESKLLAALPPRDPARTKLNAALCSFRAPLSDEPWLELTLSPIRHDLVRAVADQFERLRETDPDLPLLSEGAVHFANSIVVHLLVITSDGYVLLGHRSDRPRFYANCWAVTCEEHLDFELDGGSPFRAARRGMKEELVGKEMHLGEDAIRFFSLFRELDHWHGTKGDFWDVNIGLAGQVRLPITAKAVFARWRAVAEDKREFRHLVAVPYDAESLWRILDSEYLEPSQWGADLLVPDETDQSFPDLRHKPDWHRQHPTNKVRIIRSLTHDFLGWCHEKART